MRVMHFKRNLTQPTLNSGGNSRTSVSVKYLKRIRNNPQAALLQYLSQRVMPPTLVIVEATTKKKKKIKCQTSGKFRVLLSPPPLSLSLYISLSPSPPSLPLFAPAACIFAGLGGCCETPHTDRDQPTAPRGRCEGDTPSRGLR